MRHPEKYAGQIQDGEQYVFFFACAYLSGFYQSGAAGLTARLGLACDAHGIGRVRIVYGDCLYGNLRGYHCVKPFVG